MNPILETFEMWPIKFLLLFCVYFVVSQDAICDDSKCICTEFTGDTSHFPEVKVDCSSLDLKNVLQKNYSQVTTVDYSSNKIQTLENSDMPIESDQLRVLVFSRNEISYISDK